MVGGGHGFDLQWSWAGPGTRRTGYCRVPVAVRSNVVGLVCQAGDVEGCVNSWQLTMRSAVS